MRLTQIRLAGFKSFVDPAAINVAGVLVGVVGPNGCGKSNIIDAVRWVLGETRASALRGDSMQDVIFNGSNQRDPVARASVELCFDNSLGRASGQWSQYAEISVKRVLQRDGESSYFINNTHVRRRDVQDIFLGTGLGPRAYAIVEQGMISRIIEAKPEDLRVFLEEAAGISKYKERRRETEHRLSDTRENVSRVNDIRRELEIQVEKLEKQSEVARRFQELSSERQHKQNLLALLRRNEARAEEHKQGREIERIDIELEAETAALRENERLLEQARTEHYAAADALNTDQGALYRANSEVSRLESEIRFITETRQRIEAQLAQFRAQHDADERRAAELRETTAMWQSRLDEARVHLIAATECRAREEAKLPQAEQAHRALQDRLTELRGNIALAEQTLQLERAHASHAGKTLQNLEQREYRLMAERDEFAEPDAEMLSRLEQEVARSRDDLARQEELLSQMEEASARLGLERTEAQARVQTLERELSALDARAHALQSIQKHAGEDDRIRDWLARHALASSTRLWQRVSVVPGWETAVESVLGEKLHALEVADADSLQRLLEDPPPARATAYTAVPADELTSEPGFRPLVDFVQTNDQKLAPIVRAWLRGHYAIDGIPDREARQGLGPQMALVNREGHHFSRYGVSFYASDPADSGILARQREIEALAAEIDSGQLASEAARADLAAVSARLDEHVQGLSTLRVVGDTLNRQHHERQLEQVRRSEEHERWLQRSEQIEQEMLEIAGQKAAEDNARRGAQDKAARTTETLGRRQAELEAVSASFSAAEEALAEQRRALQQASRNEQDAMYLEREYINKIKELESLLHTLDEHLSSAAQSISVLEQELAGLQDQVLRTQLQQALEIRVSCEHALERARALQEDLSKQLRLAEESRLANEQRLQPLRDRIADLRLKEQAARLNAEQYAAQLAESGTDEVTLMASLRDGQRLPPLQGEITRLTNAINDLGAINMAALDELSTNRERKQFLDAQAADLTEALEILDTAIRRIDRETRDMLQTTFNSVNGHFGELFPALFGGGEARLEMTGEEILDCGVQVIARPPGKKNTSIHLLSGGEKALTAIALVFSMFQLNPAPFCLLDEVDAPLDDANTERFCDLVSKMSRQTQFLFISHNKLTMEMASHLIGVTMQEQGVSRVVAVDIEEALKLREPVLA